MSTVGVSYILDYIALCFVSTDYLFYIDAYETELTGGPMYTQ